MRLDPAHHVHKRHVDWLGVNEIEKSVGLIVWKHTTYNHKPEKGAQHIHPDTPVTDDPRDGISDPLCNNPYYPRNATGFNRSRSSSLKQGLIGRWLGYS